MSFGELSSVLRPAQTSNGEVWSKPAIVFRKTLALEFFFQSLLQI